MVSKEPTPAPHACGDAPYRRVLPDALGLDPDAVESVLLRAQESYCAWPVERSLRFRDIVRYTVTESYLRSHPVRLGMRADVGKIVACIIPGRPQNRSRPQGPAPKCTLERLPQELRVLQMSNEYRSNRLN